MRARVIELSVEDPRGQAYRPQDPTCFSALLNMTLGPGDGDKGDILYATVCSPSWFAENVLTSVRLHPTHEDVEHSPVFGRHYLFANIFDEEAIRAAVEQWVTSQTADTWHALAIRLSRNLAWEFEDYRPSDRDAAKGGIDPATAVATSRAAYS